MNSQKCRSKRTGKVIISYQTKAEAMYEAKRQKEKYKQDFEPYQCNDCSFWHLSPSSRSTPSKYCSSCSKQLYLSQESANKRKNIIFKEQNKSLKIYKCPYNNGWHLTSH